MDPSDENGMGESPVEEVPIDGAEGEEEDEFYENPVEMIKEFGTHPLMEKAQKARPKIERPPMGKPSGFEHLSTTFCVTDA